MNTPYDTDDTYTITFKLTRCISQDWAGAVDNEHHVGRVPRDALKRQLVDELTDCIERGFLSGEGAIEVVSLYGKVDHLTEDDAYEDAACGVGE